MIGSELPKGWDKVKLLDIADLSTGKVDANHSTEDGLYPFFTCASEPMKSPDYNFDDESVIVPGNGANVGCVLYYNGKFQAYQRTYVLSNIKIVPKYLFYHFLRYWKERTENNQFGSATNYVKLINFANYIVDMPSLTEQKQIAEKLDKLFDQIETIKEASNKIPELLKNFRQQVLTYAVTGKLTEEWRNNNNVNLIRIIDQLKEQRINEISSKVLKEKLEKIYIDNNSSIDFPIPEQWIPINLDKICESFSYGTSSKSMNEGTYPVLRMGNIQNGKLIWSDLKYTSDESEYIKYQLNVGDVLFNRTNSPELVGKTAIYDEDKKACYAGYIIRIDPYREYVNPYYLNIVLNSQYAKRWCWEHKSDGVSQSNINAQKLSKFTIPYPHIAEQNIIVERVQSLLAKLDAIEGKYNIMLENLGKLPQALLCKAFKGEMFTK